MADKIKKSGTQDKAVRGGAKPPGGALDFGIVFDATTNGLAFAEADSGKIVDVNAAWLAATGFVREKVIGKTALELGVWPDPATRAACLAELQKKGSFADFESNLSLKSVETPHLIFARTVEMDGGKYVLWEFRNIARQKQSEEKIKTLLSKSEQSRRSLLSILQDVKQAEEARHKSEERFRQLFDGAADALFVHDQEGRIVDANRVGCDRLGYTREELLRLSVSDVEVRLQPADLAPIWERIRSGQSATVEGAHRRRNGSTFPVEIHIAPFTPGDRPLFFAAARDITERKQAEEEIVRTAREWQTTFDSTKDAIWILDENHRILRTNKTAEQIFHRPCAEMIGKPCWEVMHGAKEPISECPFVRARESGHRETMDLQVDKQWFEVIVDPIFNETGQYAGAVHIVSDITERKQAQVAVEESRQMLRSVLDTIPVRVFWKDLEGRFVGCNHPFARDAGFDSPDKLIGKDDYAMGWKEQADLYRADDQKVIASGVPKLYYEEPQTTPAGKQMWVRTSKIPLRDLEGRIIGILGAYEDITERKRAEMALRESEEKHRVLIETTATGFVIVDDKGCVLDANDEYVRLAGHERREQILGRCVTEWTAKHDLERNAEAVKKCAASGFVRGLEVDYLHPDGNVVPIEINASTLGTGDNLKILTLCRDITERKLAEEAMLASEVRYRRLFEAARDGILILDAETGMVVDVNPFLIEKLGFPREVFLGKKVWELGFFKDIFTNQANFAELQKKEYIRYENLPLETADGRRLEVEFVSNVYQVNHYKVIQCNIRDIAERKRAERALQASETRFRTLIERSPLAISISRDGRTIYANQKYLDLYGFQSVDELVGQQVTDQWAPEFREMVMERAQQRARGETVPSEYEGLGLRKDGSQFPVQISVSLVELPDGAAFMAFLTNITERRQAEERIREQAALLDAASDAIYVRTLDHTVTYWNDGAERLYGLTRAEALGRKILELGEVDRNAFESAHAALLEQGHWSGELKKISKAGKKFTAFCRWTLLRDESGRPKEILAINTDITERKQLESNFLRAQRMEGIGALAGGIAHDLNNILQPILITAPLLRETITDPESRSLLDTVENSAQRGADIIKQLLTFARGAPEVRVPLPVHHLMNDLDKIIRETFPRNIRLAIDASKDLWPVMGDATQIHQALMNLCVNARDAMSNGGALTLAAKNLTLDENFTAMTPDAKPGTYICVSVTDTGTGIPAEHFDRIFDPFFTTKEIGKGTGLGLATVLGIVRGHGGFVRVNSRVGQGTTFELYLPASPKEKAPEKSGHKALPPERHGELILVVDDEAPVREVIRRTLDKHGYHVAIAAEGSEAMAFFAQHRAEIKAVITDLMMPGMDGPALIRALRHLDPQLPVLAMTGMGEQADLKAIQNLGLPLLLKPFVRGELLATLHQAIAAAESDRTKK